MDNESLAKLAAITPEQSQALDALRRHNQANVIFYWLLAVFTIVLGVFVYSVVWLNVHPVPLTVLLGVDGVIGWSIKYVVAYLFRLPEPPKEIPTTPEKPQLPA